MISPHSKDIDTQSGLIQNFLNKSIFLIQFPCGTTSIIIFIILLQNLGATNSEKTEQLLSSSSLQMQVNFNIPNSNSLLEKYTLFT